MQYSFSRPAASSSPTAPTSPFDSTSCAWPASDGKTSTGRPVVTVHDHPAAGQPHLTHRPRPPLSSSHQVRVERVPPGQVVVRVRHLAQGHRVALPAQGGGHQPVVRQVLLGRAAGEHHPHRAPGRSVAVHRGHRGHDPGEVGEVGLAGIQLRGEEAARLQEQPGHPIRMPPLQVQRGERAEAGPHQHRGPGGAQDAVQLRQHGGGSAPRCRPDRPSTGRRAGRARPAPAGTGVAGRR